MASSPIGVLYGRTRPSGLVDGHVVPPRGSATASELRGRLRGVASIPASTIARLDAMSDDDIVSLYEVLYNSGAPAPPVGSSGAAPSSSSNAPSRFPPRDPAMTEAMMRAKIATIIGQSFAGMIAPADVPVLYDRMAAASAAATTDAAWNSAVGGFVADFASLGAGNIGADRVHEVATTGHTSGPVVEGIRPPIGGIPHPDGVLQVQARPPRGYMSHHEHQEHFVRHNNRVVSIAIGVGLGAVGVLAILAIIESAKVSTVKT